MKSIMFSLTTIIFAQSLNEQKWLLVYMKIKHQSISIFMF